MPNDKAWSDLDRRSLTFRRATMPGYTEYRYCQLSFALPPGEGTREVAHRGQKADLPFWFRPLLRRIKLKKTVRRTRGTDAESLVVLVPRDDYQAMIRIFMASKAWVRKRGISLRT